jgi:hypothetical protein
MAELEHQAVLAEQQYHVLVVVVEPVITEALQEMELQLLAVVVVVISLELTAQLIQVAVAVVVDTTLLLSKFQVQAVQA